MPNSTCSVPECERKHAAKGYCQLHWNRNRLHGDPLVTMKGKYHKSQYTSDGLRLCKGCGEAKPLTEYHKDANGTDGYRAKCKPCRSVYMKGYQETNADARREYTQRRMRENGDRVRELDRLRYERDKEKRVALASEQVKIRRARLAGVITDPAVNVPALREIHGDACCYCGVEMSFIRRPRGSGLAPNRATLEHILPISRGGSHTFENTALACHRCNVSKNDKTPEEWLASRAATAS